MLFSQRTNALLLSILLLGFGVPLGVAIRCYVCGPLDKGFQSTCEHFALNISEYEQQCPEAYGGCSTHFEEHTQRRECERLRFNDCKKANGIEYCYCTTNLCNGITSQLQETDDEDILDVAGSGEGPRSKQENINVIIQDVGDSNRIKPVETIEAEANNASSMTVYMLSLMLFVFCMLCQ